MSRVSSEEWRAQVKARLAAGGTDQGTSVGDWLAILAHHYRTAGAAVLDGDAVWVREAKNHFLDQPVPSPLDILRIVKAAGRMAAMDTLHQRRRPYRGDD